jgi:hypothetical protein
MCLFLIPILGHIICPFFILLFYNMYLYVSHYKPNKELLLLLYNYKKCIIHADRK